MNDAVNSYISPTKSGTTDGYPIIRDFQHAAKLYIASSYARSPKFGFLYYVQLNINENAIIDEQWLEQKKSKEVGLLVKKADLPKFQIANETLNQYNRKTVVNTKLTYQPVSIELHDDNSNITQNLWLNYYKHHFADGNYGNGGSDSSSTRSPDAFNDTKYGTIDYTYGKYSRNIQGEFFKSVDLFVFHRKEFTKYTLVNPKIAEWTHDSVGQAEGNRVLQNKLTLTYESVIYSTGTIIPGKNPESWIPVYYDNTPSPYGIAGNPVANQSTNRTTNSPFDARAKERVYGRVGGPYNSPNPLLDIASILAKNYVNKSGLTRQKAVGYNVASSALGAISATAPGKYSSPPSTQDQTGIFNLPGGVGINIFKGFNTSVDGKIRANPASIIFPPRG